MSVKTKLGLVGGILCLIIPILCRTPRGWTWVAQYLPDPEHFLLGILFFSAFAALPAGVVFFAARVSTSPLQLPFAFSSLTALSALAFWHHDNDICADAQAAISLIFIPIYSAGLAIAGAVIGGTVQVVVFDWTQH